MPGKINKKSKALKEKTQNNFLRALLFGILATAVTWIMLAIVFALLLTYTSDSDPFINVLSYVVVIVSLAVGGFVVGKLDKAGSGLASLTLGFAVLAVCYLVSSSLNISRELGVVMKTVVIALMIVSPLVGTGISTRNKSKRTKRSK